MSNASEQTHVMNLRKRWETEAKALAQFGNRYVVTAGMIYPKRGTHPGVEDQSAIDYLILEHGYGYGGSTL